MNTLYMVLFNKFSSPLDGSVREQGTIDRISSRKNGLIKNELS